MIKKKKKVSFNDEVKINYLDYNTNNCQNLLKNKKNLFFLFLFVIFMLLFLY